MIRREKRKIPYTTARQLPNRSRRYFGIDDNLVLLHNPYFSKLPSIQGRSEIQRRISRNSTETQFFMSRLPISRHVLKTLQHIFVPFFLIVCMPMVLADQMSLITSSVRLRVDSPGGHDWGTGTIIDTREGEALILTCGHIFRESQGQGTIEVHLFGENSMIKVLGTCLYYDADEMDLALVAITAPGPVRAMPIAPACYRIQPLQAVWSVGCDHGGNPTVRSHHVMSIDKIHTPAHHRIPFPYVQVSGSPVAGRSGGGLFSNDGYLIGVCNTGCPMVNDGHFVPPHIIRHVLDKMNLAYVYRNPSLGSPSLAYPPPPHHTASLPAQSTSLLTALPNLSPLMATPEGKIADQHAGICQTEICQTELATLEEIKRRKQDGDEVILIIRSRRNPEIPSDVIILNGTSDQFLDNLFKHQQAHTAQTPTARGPSQNTVILSSHSTEPIQSAERQPVSFPIRY